ncbi:hypothetical protein [Actibacterium sp. 188UL27-1]|uniref:hypothetical protein n=1 Tax=Actibacterium sp. 188UL27-1 TaxID=2786961 RepID=UPI0019597354|nr:hypothetical protein [Actibacterium sp. 188UL27-1]MBM7069102.1 hypothetical protein [Actibacterium sp. 188UL27-1]
MTDNTDGHIAFFGHNAGDAAVRRRADAFLKSGYEVTGFMPHRGPVLASPWPVIDLGETRDNDYLHRIRSIFSGARLAMAHSDILRDASLIYARNLDMLATAAHVKRRLGLNAALVYECLDIHHKLTGHSAIAKILRRIERRLLQQSALVVISSPRFEAEHFAVHHPGQYRSFLIENRLVADEGLPERPQPSAPSDGPLRIGWFGNLRCRRSLDLLLDLAKRFPDDVLIYLRGYPALGVFPDFEGEIAPYPNVTYGGRYQAPDDLELIYRAVDVVWAGDWYEAGANSVWLLPNRVYEGGYFTTPALAPSGTETAAWLTRNNAGLLVDDPVEQTLPDLVDRLIKDRNMVHEQQIKLLDCPRSTFVQDANIIPRMVAIAQMKTP